MYLMTCTRPDLAYPLSILARYVAPERHQPEHMAAAKRVLHYLCSTSGLGLVLGGRSPVVLTGHADASWVDDLATQRSSQGYTFSLGSGSVSWRSTRSSSVFSSSCEAEIYAGAMAAQELRWLTYLLTDLGEPPRSPPVLYVDNKAMLALCREHRLEHRTKHIALRYFLARELQQRGQLRLAYVASKANTADIFTKALPPACFALLDWSCDLMFSPTLPMGGFLLIPNILLVHSFLISSHADPSLFLRTDASLPPFYVLVYVDDLVFATADTEALTHVKSELQKRHTCTDLGPSALRLHLLLATVHSQLHLRTSPTSGMGLVLGGRARVVLTGHADASWVDDLATQRSSQGYTFSLGSGFVSWRSTRSSSVVSSSCEAEIYAGAMAAQELRWLTYLLTDLGEAPRSPLVLTKHIALRYFLARELQQRGQLRLAYVASQANTADVFTKALQPCDHQPCFACLDWSCDLLFSPTLPMG
ncbi:unnamed protein product, partial [Closterium sp. NIES-53]